MRWLALTLCCVAIGCGDDAPSAPPLPPDAGGGGIGGFVGGGSGGRDEDAGQLLMDASTDSSIDATTDAGPAMTPPLSRAECSDGIDLPTLVNQVFIPGDLVVSRGFAHWTGSCADPVLEIGLSGGNCLAGDQHELSIQIDADAITNQTIFIPGANQLAVDRPDEAIRVRYTRPSGRSPVGTWGTCRGVAGALNVESLDVSRDGRLAGTFDFNLGTCDGGSTAAFAIGGTFDLRLARRLSDVCP